MSMKNGLHEALLEHSRTRDGGDPVPVYDTIMDVLTIPSVARAIPNGHDILLSMLRDANIALFSERGFPLSSRHHAMLQTCKDHVWLDRWLRRGINAICPADVFD